RSERTEYVPLDQYRSGGRHQHGVDDVHRGVRGLHVAADDLGVTDAEVLARAVDGDLVALDGLVATGELVRGELTRDHVEGQDLGQQRLVGEHGLEVLRRDLGERVVGRGQDGPALAAVQGVDQR